MFVIMSKVCIYTVSTYVVLELTALISSVKSHWKHVNKSHKVYYISNFNGFSQMKLRHGLSLKFIYFSPFH